MTRTPGSRFGVIGAGILGAAVARRLTQMLPGAEVVVLDKEDRVGAHQTGHSSGVVHAGLYYPPGSLKATLCRRGSGLLREYCADRRVPLLECGKLVIAVDAAERGRLETLRERAEANGVPGLAMLGPEGIREIEPQARGAAALHSPTTAITDFVAVAQALIGDARAAGARILLSTPVSRIEPAGDGVRIILGHSSLDVDRLVICAGLASDTLARQAGHDADPAIVPFRGEYLRLRRPSLVRGLIYPVPDPAYPFLGVHFSRRVDGGVDLGPNAVLALAREGYRRRDVDLAELRDMLASPAFRRMARRHWRAGVSQVARTASVRGYVRLARRYVPALRREDVERGLTGVRAQAIDADGTLVDDFRITRRGPVLAVRNAPSPAATSSLAIAELVCAELL